jgi:putative hemolysin
MTDTVHRGAEDAGFTYSHPGQTPFRRAVIRAVERVSGQPMLRDLYLDWSRGGRRGDEDVFTAAMRLLRIEPQMDWRVPAAAIPAEGGLLLVANHPFGIVDGLSLGQLGMRLRGNVQILTHSLLCEPREIGPHLLPIDFSGTAQARRVSAQSRRLAVELLAAGKVVAVFPAGGIATANKPLRGPAFDGDWHGFVGRLATIPGVTTLPVHFSGQNSRIFQIVSHLSYPLRIALIFNETRRRMGRPVAMTVGAPIAAADLSRLRREDVVRELRRRTMALGSARDEVFVWPKHLKV